MFTLCRSSGTCCPQLFYGGDLVFPRSKIGEKNFEITINGHFKKAPKHFNATNSVSMEVHINLEEHRMLCGHGIFLSTILFKHASRIRRILHICLDIFDFLMHYYCTTTYNYRGLYSTFYDMCSAQYFVENSRPTNEIIKSTDIVGLYQIMSTFLKKTTNLSQRGPDFV